MTPCLVPADSPLGQLQGGTNMVVLEGDSVGQIVLRGPGAGMGPTASAVMADVADIARGLRLSTFGQPAASLAAPIAAKSSTPASYYLRMTLLDKPGALAKIATCLGEAGVSIDQMRQYGHEGTNAPVLIVTHKASRDDIDHAMGRFAATGVLVGAPVAARPWTRARRKVLVESRVDATATLIRALGELGRRMLTDERRLAELCTRENGKPIAEAVAEVAAPPKKKR